ncbi:MAG: hypothetical protein SH807_11645 [Blastochloris sp.]|jgi:uncharacterized protein YbaR (Trm112 family)|nr:hypothetical protein [Blastochloris sp.]
MNTELLDHLCCPETHQRLTFATPETLTRINVTIGQGTCKNHAGQVVSEILESALIREDGSKLYPIRKDIPVLLIDEALSCPAS